MQIWMATVGAVLILLAIFDAFSTTLTASTAAGPVTARVGDGLWRLARRIAHGPRSVLLSVSGPFILVTTIGLWMLLLWAGWWLVFAADPAAIVATATGTPASGWERVYYTAYTLFTLGNGEFRPTGAPFQVLTGVAVANGLVLVTLAITYVIPVVTAVTERRQQAATISGIGTTAQELLVNAWDGATLRFLDQPLLRFAEDINRTAQRHVTYPILHFFHSDHRTDEFPVSVTALDEALTIISLAVDEAVRPHPASVRATRVAIGRLLAILQDSFHDAAEHPPPPPALSSLREAGIPVVDDATFASRLGEVADRRRVLRGFATSSPWPWEEAVETVQP